MNVPTAWAWDALLDPIVGLAAKAATKTVSKGGEALVAKSKSLWEQVQWSAGCAKYRDNLYELVRSTKVLGHPKAIEIDKIYTDVYVFDKLTALRRFSGELDEDDIDPSTQFEAIERLSAFDVFSRSSNLLILGQPGAGKTTFLKYLALLACKGTISRTPIFVSLKDWSDSQAALIDYIAQQFDVCGFPDAKLFVTTLMSKGKALVLLDGLDEVNEWQDKRSLVIRDIVKFSDKYRKCQWCVTCRVAAVDYSFERFKYVEVADFTEEQQESFAKHWYVDDSVGFAKFLEEWNQSKNRGLRDLGRTPLLLALLCLAFDETMSFPARQVDLYQESLDALLKKWDSSRRIKRDEFYKGMSYTRREHLLESVASHFYFRSRTVFRRAEVVGVVSEFISKLPDKDVDASIDALAVIKAIEAQHGLLVEKAVGFFAFSHLTFQEYFTASHIVKTQRESVQNQIIKSALTDQKWREVMLYTIGLMPSADDLLAEMLRQLGAMKGASSGVLMFLAFCFCDGIVRARGPKDKSPMPRFHRVPVDELRENIGEYIGTTRQPALSPSEFSKVVEHIQKLDDYLTARGQKYDFGLSPQVIKSAVRLVKNEPIETASLLGGYFVRPEKFLQWLYGCRLVLECLEVAVTGHRSRFVQELFALTNEEAKLIFAELDRGSARDSDHRENN